MDDQIREKQPERNGYLVSNTTNCTSLVCDIIRENNSTILIDGDITAGTSDSLKAIIGVVYVLAILIGTSGNFLVVLVVAKKKIPITSTNLFISSLAGADLLVTGLCMPCFFTYYIITWPQFPLGVIGCKILSYTVHTSALASSLNLLAIAYDRYFAMSLPFRKILTPQNSKILICIIWIVSLLALIPSAISHNLIRFHINGQPAVQCEEMWSSLSSKNAYLLFRVGFYWLLVIQIALLYFYAGKKILRVRAPNHSRINISRLHTDKRKIMKIMLLVVLIFIICWFPYMLVKMLYVFPPTREFKIPEFVVFIANVLAMINSAVNPIIYASMNGHYLRAFQSVLQSSNTKNNNSPVGQHKIESDRRVRFLNDGQRTRNFRDNVGFHSSTAVNNIQPHIIVNHEDFLCEGGCYKDSGEDLSFVLPMKRISTKNKHSPKLCTSKHCSGEERDEQYSCTKNWRSSTRKRMKVISSQSSRNEHSNVSKCFGHSTCRVEFRDLVLNQSCQEKCCSCNDGIVSKKVDNPILKNSFPDCGKKDERLVCRSRSIINNQSFPNGDTGNCHKHGISLDQSLTETSKGIASVELNLELAEYPSDVAIKQFPLPEVINVLQTVSESQR